MKASSFRRWTVASLAPVVIAGACLNWHQAARAVPVAANTTQFLHGTTEAARPELAGTVLEDRVRPFNLNQYRGRAPKSGWKVTGTFQDRVVRRNDGHTLDFYFRVTNDASSTGDIVVIRRTGFGHYPVVDSDYRVDGLGQIGAASVSSDDSSTRINFDFTAVHIQPGQQSRFHFIGVRATSYNERGVAFLDANNGVFTTFNVFEPNVGARRPPRPHP